MTAATAPSPGMPRPVMQPGETLCRITDLSDPGSREFRIATARGPRFMFVVRKGDTVNAYMNWCPHYGATMDWKLDTFLTHDKTAILCALHGAEFVIESGECTLGPCEGERLIRVEVRVEGGDRIVYDGTKEMTPPKEG
jgi:nitrite reductase/ring-hydroxylating ferredoxin subunit